MASCLRFIAQERKKFSLSSRFLIYANYYLNWSTVVVCVVNIIAMMILSITAVANRHDLNEIVTGADWKKPVIVSDILAIGGLGCLFLPSMGIAVYWFAFLALALQIFFLLDDYHALAREIVQPEWYLTCHKICAFVASVTIICLTLFLLTTIAVTDY